MAEVNEKIKDLHRSRVDLFRELARQSRESKADFDHYDDLLDAFKNETGNMTRLFEILCRDWSHGVKEIQRACYFYLSSDKCTVKDAEALRDVLSGWTLFIVHMAKFSDFIYLKNHFYERLEDELSQMQEKIE